MNLENLRIEIKRATKDGIKKAIGKYFECNNVQYCFIKDITDCNFYLIHLDTGYSACELPIKGTNEKKAFELLKQKVSKIDKKDLMKKVKEKQEDMKSRGLVCPLN